MSETENEREPGAVRDEDLPDDVRPDEDNPLAEPLADDVDPDDLDLHGGKTAEESGGHGASGDGDDPA